ncbi:hypothetical protein [Hymenobacter ruber]
MAKIIGYPRASFHASFELAEAVYSLGGRSDIEVCAQKMGKKVTGAFSAIVGAASKFNLVSVSKGTLITSSLFRDIQLAYTDPQKLALKAEAFLSPPVFKGIAEKFGGMILPQSAVLSKMLIKEFEVDDAIASTVANYFVDGAKSVGLFDGEGKLRSIQSTQQESETMAVEVFDAPNESLPQNNKLSNRHISDAEYTPVEVANNDRRKIQIPLPQKRMAELIVPDEMTIKDLDIIRMQLEVLRVFIENS